MVNKDVLEAFENFRRKHSKQNKDIIVNNTLLNLRNQQLQQDLARLCDENTQLRLLLSMSQYEIKVKHNNVIDDVIKSLNKLKSSYEPTTSKPVIQPIERRVVSLTPSLEPIQEFQSQSQSQTRKARFEQSSSSENDEVPSEEAIRDRRKSNSRRRQSGLQNPNVVLNDEPTTNANVNNDIIENENNHQNQSQIFDSLDPLKPDNSIPKRSSTKSRRESTDDKSDINPLKYSNGPRRRSSVNTSPSTTTTAKSKPKVQRASSPKAKTRRSSNQILPTSQTDKVNDENANNNESMNIINENIVNSENLASSTTSSNEEIEGRSSRRSRKSVNYALPSLRTKMRKPDPLDTVPAKPSNGSANELAKALADQNISDM